jgi:hypothetical protein
MRRVSYTPAALEDSRVYGAVPPATLIPLAMLIVPYTTQAARTDTSPAKGPPQRRRSTATEKTPEPAAQANKQADESAYEKLRLDGKPTIERPVPEEPAPKNRSLPSSPPRNPNVTRNRVSRVLRRKQQLPHPGSLGLPREPRRKKLRAARPEGANSGTEHSRDSSAVPFPIPKPTDIGLSLTIPRLGLTDVRRPGTPQGSPTWVGRGSCTSPGPASPPHLRATPHHPGGAGQVAGRIFGFLLFLFVLGAPNARSHLWLCVCRRGHL